MSESIEAEVERWSREVRKGSTRLALLSLLSRGESYGYEVLSTLKARRLDALSTTEASVYPLLHDLEKRGFLTSEWRTTEPGVPSRKYYLLTAEGVELYEALRRSWAGYRDQMDDLLEGE